MHSQSTRPNRLAAALLLIASLVPAGCVRTGPPMPVLPTVSLQDAQLVSATPPPATPTLSYRLPVASAQGAPEYTSTPDAPHYQPQSASAPQSYVVRQGDFLSAIALRYGVPVEALVAENGLLDPNTLEVGQLLTIPVVPPQPTGPAFKLIPDSELVYGPASRLDVSAFVQSRAGYLASFVQVVDGQQLSGAQIIQRVAESYSVNPRLLLALLEYRSGWVTGPDRSSLGSEQPLGFYDAWYTGLYRQMVWAANTLNTGYYSWRYGLNTGWVISDGSLVPVDPTINPGTAGVQYLFAQLDDYPTWLQDVSPGGFYDTYYLLFGFPFAQAVEPLIPAPLEQPELWLPFNPGEVWAFTGGPHAAWDSGSPYGALDFAPPGEAQGCVQDDHWVTAVAEGVVTRTGGGVVALDLDLDGLEQTGWVIVYMHIEQRDRVQPGTRLRAGDPLGHASCEGGISSGTHVHLARKFNGEWIPVNGLTPFTLSGWLAAGTGEEYVGSLSRNGQVVQSFEGNSSINQISR